MFKIYRVCGLCRPAAAPRRQRLSVALMYHHVPIMPTVADMTAQPDTAWPSDGVARGGRRVSGGEDGGPARRRFVIREHSPDDAASPFTRWCWNDNCENYPSWRSTQS